MPNHGAADNTSECYRNGNGQRQVEVSVGFRIYYDGAWRGWYQHP
ncbi:hypothetical protein [Amycolatopsis sp. MJM2582]|nr:hypothetical protein [Amycolatopsis sp. MJM2582]